MKLIKLLYSVIVSGITAFTDWLNAPGVDVYKRALYPPRPDGLQEESYECAKLWHIFWNTQRVRLEKKKRWVNNVRVFEGSMKDIKPTEAKFKEYLQPVLVTFKLEGGISLGEIRIESDVDTEDFSLYQMFDSKEREVESKRSISFPAAERYRKRLKELWDNKVKEQIENKRIKNENSKIWQEHFSRQEERRRNEPKGLFWPFGGA